ncbi:MAG: hypothetical protein R6V56_03465 [Lentisphaeria bacterium]
MQNKFRVLVFGKAGCPKCKVLNQRLDSLLKKDEWKNFEKVYCDVESEEGMVSFCKSECVNPQRIPAFLITKLNSETGKFTPLPNPTMGKEDKVCKDSKLFTYLGIQTDYTDRGRGVISPKMIKSVFTQALEQA